MCSVFKVSRSGYYSWLHFKPSKRFLINKEITRRIISIHQQSNQTYGSPRITKALRKESIVVSRIRVARLMKKAKIRSIIKSKFKVTTDSRHNYPIVPNRLNRNFESKQIGKAWVSDITYIPTNKGWLYLTTVLDLADRKVIGWSLSESMKASDTSIAAFKMAVKNRPIEGEIIFHSDRGIQYACTEFSTLLDTTYGVIRSMSRKGNCWDNAVAESFFKSFKSEVVYKTKFNTIEDAMIATFEYIEIWYNRRRLHSSLGYRTPEEMEQFLISKKIAA